MNTSRLTKLVVSAVIIGLTLSVLVSWALGATATIADWPEADIYNAFDAKEKKGIWNKPGNLVLESKSWPVSRITVSLYDDEQTEGFYTITHTNPFSSDSITFYFNFDRLPEKRSVISFRSPSGGNLNGMWEEAFLNLVPFTRAPESVWDQIPFSARLLLILPPYEGHINKNKEGYVLHLFFGGDNINGRVEIPLNGLEEFVYKSRMGRPVRVWAGTTERINLVKWWTSANSKGEYEWRPGMKEPLFHKDNTPL